MQSLTPKTLLLHLGVQFAERTNRLSLCCPFHDDRNPSAGFYDDSQKFFCYTCSLSLDCVGFYAKYMGVNRSKAETELESVFGPIPKSELEDRQNVVNRARARAEKILLKARQQGLKQCVESEESLEEILWRYEKGRIPLAKFHALMARWIEESDDGQSTSTLVPLTQVLE